MSRNLHEQIVPNGNRKCLSKQEASAKHAISEQDQTANQLQAITGGATTAATQSALALSQLALSEEKKVAVIVTAMQKEAELASVRELGLINERLQSQQAIIAAVRGGIFEIDVTYTVEDQS